MEWQSAIDNVSESNRVGADFLINDAKTAITLLDLAETTNNDENCSRRVDEAHKAYRSILSFVGRLKPGPEQMKILRRDLAILARRLKVAGVEIDEEI